MKLYKSFCCMAIIAMTAIFSGCNEDGYWDGAPATDGVKYSFDKKELSVKFKSTEPLDEVVITVTRSSDKGAASLPVNAVFSDEFALSGASEVVFEDGEQTAEYTIKLGKLVVGKTYTIKLSFDEEMVSSSGISEATVSVLMEYNWIAAGKAEFYSAWSGQIDMDNGEIVGDPVVVNVEYAEGTEGLYRLNSPYYYSEKASGASAKLETGHHIQFYVDPETGEALDFAARSQSIGENISGYGDFYLYHHAASFGTYIANSGNTYFYLGIIAYSSDGKGLSLFDYEMATFVWTEGYPW